MIVVLQVCMYNTVASNVIMYTWAGVECNLVLKYKFTVPVLLFHATLYFYSITESSHLTENTDREHFTA